MVTKKTFNSRMGKGGGKKQGFIFKKNNNLLFLNFVNKNTLRFMLNIKLKFNLFNKSKISPFWYMYFFIFYKLFHINISKKKHFRSKILIRTSAFHYKNSHKFLMCDGLTINIFLNRYFQNKNFLRELFFFSKNINFWNSPIYCTIKYSL